jgi:hypothetical protein
VQQETHVEMPGGQTERAGDRMDVQMQRLRIDLKIADAGFLGRLSQRRRRESGVTFLTVAAELKPAADPRMQGQQHLCPVV